MDTTERDKFLYTPLPEPIPITEQKWPKGTLPLVQTRTMTYMHEEFIRDCIEGLLIQKTTFPVQILIHDDASTDNTAKIVREYEKKYPRLIKAYYQKENTYRHPQKREMRKEFRDWFIGKYIAVCEGDDYWTDPEKIQKQVSYLEENEEYVMTYHGSVDLIDGKLTGDTNYMPRTPTRLYRNIKLNYPEILTTALNGDTILRLLLEEHGKFALLKDIKPSVRRVHSRGVYRSLSELDKLNAGIDTADKLLIAFKDTDKKFKYKLRYARKLYEYRMYIKKNKMNYGANCSLRNIYTKNIIPYYIFVFLYKKILFLFKLY